MTWVWLSGMVVGGFLGTLLGQWMTWLLLRNPLRRAARIYREVWRDSVRLYAAKADAVDRVNARVNPRTRC